MRTVRRSSDVSHAWATWRGPALPALVCVALLCLGIANIAARATWRAGEDGVLWTAQPEGVIAADGAAAARGLGRAVRTSPARAARSLLLPPPRGLLRGAGWRGGAAAPPARPRHAP